jgi:hypothetical protein
MAQDLHQRALEDSIRARLAYDAATGVFSRLVDGGRGAKAGDPAGFVSKSGYITVSVRNRTLYAHRVAWFLTHGEWPGIIDHINGDRTDNRLVNLRNVDARINAQNVTRPRTSGTSCFLGVTSGRGGKWRAQIVINGRGKYLGEFSTPELAHASYIAAKAVFHEGFVQ